jgi:hypothetical protein
MEQRGQVRRRGRGGAWRALACALGLAAMLGQVAGYAHLAFTSHVTCAEHGELVEADNGGEQGASAADTLAAREHAAGGHADLSAAAEGAHGHDHCTIAPHRRDRVTHDGARVRLDSASATVADGIRFAVAPPRPIALLALAPKSSPPV